MFRKGLNLIEKTKRLMICIIVSVLCSSAFAFELNDTTVRSNGLNSEFNVSYSWIFYNLTIDSSFIYFGGFNQSKYEPNGTDPYSISFFYYENDVNYTGEQIPYVSTTSTTSAIITSYLADDINATVGFNANFCNLITGASYTSASSTYQQNITSIECKEGLAFMNITGIETGNNTINFDYFSSIVNCSEGDAQNILKMTIFDENTPPQELISDVEVEIDYWTDPNFVNNYYFGTGGNSSYYICLAGANTTQADVYVKYTTANGFTHRYYLVNQTLINTSTLNVSMYNFNTTTSISDLKLTTRLESDYNYYTNVIGMLQRRYPAEGVWRTVQMDESGDYGLIFFNILEETTDYRVIFKDRDNCVLDTTDRMKFACVSGLCDLTFLLSECDDSGASNNFQYSWNYNNVTGNISLIWVDLTGITSTTRLFVSKETGTGNTTICDETKAGSSGTLSCSVAGYTGEVLLRAYSTASPERPIVSAWVRLTQPSLGSLIPSAEGALWTVGIMVTVMSFGIIISPVAAILTTIMGLVMVLFLGIFTPLTSTFVIIACVMGIVIGIKVRA